MNQTYKLKYPLILFLINLGILNSYGQSETFDKTIRVSQYGSILNSMNIHDSVVLKRDSFSIEFKSRRYEEKGDRFYAVRVAAVMEDSCLRYIKDGQVIDEIPFFAVGTGLAAEETGYNNLFIDNEAHHYIFYTDDKDRRATLIEKDGKLLRLRWIIPQAFHNGQDVMFKDLPLDKIYLILLNDGNLNNVIDNGEFVIMSVRFE